MRYFFLLLVFLFSIPNGDAQVIKRIIDTTYYETELEDYFFYDFDLNGTNDFVINISNDYYTDDTFNFYVHFGSYVGNEIVMPAPLDVAVFDYGDTIDSTVVGWDTTRFAVTGNGTPNFIYDARLSHRTNGTFCNGSHSLGCGNFRDMEHKFVGVRFFKNGNTHYGYFEISIETTLLWNSYTTIHSLAYNTIPDEPIIAGFPCDEFYSYVDADNDGYGDPNVDTLYCVIPPGYVDNNLDCDDADPNMNPDAIEVCNKIDDNCNGEVDEGFDTTWYLDNDNDSFGDPMNPTTDCNQPNGYVKDSTDCDDSNPNINRNAEEICNNLDDNCDGEIDNGVGEVWYFDNDNDSYGDPMIQTISCNQPTGYVTNNLDCNDSNPNINPDAEEICNDLDDNCNGAYNEGIEYTWYLDLDNDYFGDPNFRIDSCSQPTGYADNGLDCNDLDPNVNPDMNEICDGIDNNCDGQVDEGFTQNTYYLDQDMDGFGDPNTGFSDCDQAPGTVLNNLDCNDTNPNINPNAAEACNTIDDNCDGLIDNGISNFTIYRDLDQDGFGDNLQTLDTCEMLVGYVMNGNDCNDTNPMINPNATERCNGVDDNCNAEIDESNLMLSITKMNISMPGAMDGSVLAVPSNGIPPYEYLWNTGGTDPGISNLPAGDYTVTITDAGNCTSSQTTSIGINSVQPITEAFVVTSAISCNGECNGSLEVQNIVGGIAPYDILWSNGTSSIINDKLCADVYTYIIQDTFGNSYYDTILLRQPEALIVELIADSSFIVSGGTPPYSEAKYTYEGNDIIISINDLNKCEGLDTIFNVSNHDNYLDKALTIFPNPFKEIIYLNFEQVDLADISIQILDNTGKLTVSHAYKSQLDLSELPSGFYFLRVSQNGMMTHRKILKH